MIDIACVGILVADVIVSPVEKMPEKTKETFVRGAN